jgi:hypothetical protein
MNGRTILALVLIAYGLIAFYIAFARPKVIWTLGKLQGFHQLLTEKGTAIFLTFIGVITVGLGVVLLV